MSVVEDLTEKRYKDKDLASILAGENTLHIRYLPQVSYGDALAWQHGLLRSKASYLLLLEHHHVYTAGIRTKKEHLLIKDVASVGAELADADRGGDITYHGPGQLVGYFITDVKLSKDAIPNHVHKIERLVIDVLEHLTAGEAAGKEVDEDERPVFFVRDGFPGVWVTTGSGTVEKICSVGVRVSHGRSMHGFALNISTNMAMFSHIVPCGISDCKMTSLKELGYKYSVDDAADIFISRAAQLMQSPERSNIHTTIQKKYLPLTNSTRTQKIDFPGPQDLNNHSSDSDRVLSRPLLRLEKAGVELSKTISISSKKPDWLRAKLSTERNFFSSYTTVKSNGLVTVCEEAGCPNISECWSEGTATFMINGDRCTRSCGFCLVDTSKPFPIDSTEPDRVAKAVEEMGLSHAVVTAVARDDLPDGGALAFAQTIRAIRNRCPGVTVEVLIPDCKGDPKSLGVIFDEKPDVLNHNVETILRLQNVIRPQASYARSLSVLARAKKAGLITKSSIMVGLSETKEEIFDTLTDLFNVGVSIVTIGQYLRPTTHHLPVVKWWLPEEFDELKDMAYLLGFDHVESSPLTRSSYHAKQAVTKACDTDKK